MEINTNAGKTYTVVSEAGCTVSTAEGKLIKEIAAGQDYFTAIGGKTVISDASAVVQEVFKLAPYLKLTLLGVVGGNGGLPAGYTRVGYLESTGKQYIDTGFFSKDFLDVTIKTDYATTTKSWNLFGSYRKNGYSLNIGTSLTNGFFLAGYFFSSKGLNYEPVELNFFYKIRLSKEGFWVDNQKIGVFEMYPEAEILKTADPFLLFGRFRQDMAAVETNYMKLKTVDARPLFNMVPALDPTGAPCMFDTVSQQPFYNQGTSDFEYPGKELAASTFALRRPVTYAQLTAHGLRRLYHVPRGYNGTKEEYAAEHGFKPLVETPQPEEGCWVPQWRETEDEIVLEWVETEPPGLEEISYSRGQENDENDLTTTE